MKITGQKKLVKQMRQMPRSVRTHVSKAIIKSTEEGAKVARTLVPVDSGELKSGIHTEYRNGGMTGIVQAAQRGEQAKAYSVEFGRKQGDRGTTAAHPYIRTAQSYVATKNKGRINRAINAAAKEAFNG